MSREKLDRTADVSKISNALKAAGPEGLKAEALRKETGMPKYAFARAIATAKADGVLSAQGQKRGTVYRSA